MSIEFKINKQEILLIKEREITTANNNIIRSMLNE